MNQTQTTHTFEDFRPKIREGHVIPQGNRIIYETNEPYDQIVLPLELADVLILCSGQFSVREIISKVYQKQGVVHFKATFKLLYTLKERGFLENGDAFNISASPFGDWKSDDEDIPLSWHISAGKRILNNNGNPYAFYVWSMFLIGLSAYGLLNLNLHIRDLLDLFSAEPIKSVILIYFANSVLLTAINVLKMVSLLILTGRLYNLSISISPFGVWLLAGEESLHLAEEKLFKLLYYLSTLMSPAAVLAVCYTLRLSAQWTLALSVLASFWMIWNLNPISFSPARKLLNLLTLGEETYMEAIALESWKTKVVQQSQREWLAYAVPITLWIGWLVGFAYCAFQVAGSIPWPPAETSTYLKTTGISLFFVTWSIGLYYLGKNAYDGYRQLLHPFLIQFYTRYTSRGSFQPAGWSIPSLLERVEELPLLSYFPESLLEEILKVSEVRSYGPRSMIIREGDPANDLYILLEGSVEVYKRTDGKSRKLSSIFPTAIFGEVAIGDGAVRNADVSAAKGATVLRIPAAKIKQLAQEANCGRELEAFKNAMMVSQYFNSAPYFRDLPRETIDVLTMKSKIIFAPKGQIIFNQGDAADAFYMVVRGSVEILINDRLASRIHQGGFFGEISLIADIPRTAAVKAADQCVFLSLSRDAFWEILVQNIELAMIIESTSERRIREDLSYYEQTKKPA